MSHAEMCHPSTGLRLKQIAAEVKEWAILHSMVGRYVPLTGAAIFFDSG